MPADATDLGLRLNIFEQLYNLDSGLQLDIDDTPFDPATEAKRAKELTGGVRPDRRRGRHPEVRQAPFAGFPRREQREWWQQYLQVAPANKHGNVLATNRQIQPWLLTLLVVDWQAPAADVVAQLRSHGPEGLFFRALAHRFSAAELAAARAQFSADWPEHRTNAQGREGYVVEEACIRAACGALPAGSARALFRGIPRNRIDTNAFRNPQAPSWDRVLLGLGLATPADRVHFAAVTKHRFYNPSAVVPWLAGTGVAGLELLAKWLTKESADDCREMLREVARVAHGPGIAGFFLDALDSRGTEVAAEWLQTHPQALLHAELSQTQADKALQFLRGVELPDLDPRRRDGRDTSGVGDVVVGRLAAAAGPPEEAPKVVAALPFEQPATPHHRRSPSR
ncbi:hypothetical protein EII12_10860 [Buchananella hordeovulneris]|uniref:hypothetical protein n=1 Tax=Buchananella hordeovulneris TaxID=52770 RepID=UPI000F5E0ABC|nr:hypothetical protein [Buchananella hordeovulneris]RRD49013.1 hypothetical protein EII12_10860 [Buchananella hordeovulneris]